MASEEDSWTSHKAKGNSLYSCHKYQQAADHYSKAINILETQELAEDLLKKIRVEFAKIHSNRSAARYHLCSDKADTKEGRTTLWEALADGVSCIRLDPSFITGYYRCFDVLMVLGDESEAVSYIMKLLKAVKKSAREIRADKALHSAMKRCRYYSATKHLSPQWSKVKYKDNCVVVDWSGAGDFTDVSSAVVLQSEVSILVKPGTYKTTGDTMIWPQQKVDIIADVRDDTEEVTLKCSGPAMAPETRNILSVVGGELTLTGVTLRQESMHPERHAIYIDCESKVEVVDVKGYAKVAACIAATNSNLTIRGSEFDTCGAIILVAGSEALIQHCRIRNCIRMGVELRDRAIATLEDTEIVNCGLQGIVSHAGARGFTLTRCLLHNNARQLGNEGSAMMSSGSGKITDTQITGNVAGGIMVSTEGSCDVERCIITGGKFGVGFSLRGTAHIKDCTIRSTMVGIAVMNNLQAQITLENVNIDHTCVMPIAKGDEDIEPTIIGQQYSVKESGSVHASDRDYNVLRRMQKMKLKDRLKKRDDNLYDPRQVNPQRERVCEPCGLSQTTVGTKFRVCSGCKMSWYCSKQCQKKDWRMHKEECQKLQVTLRSEERDV